MSSIREISIEDEIRSESNHGKNGYVLRYNSPVVGKLRWYKPEELRLLVSNLGDDIIIHDDTAFYSLRISRDGITLRDYLARRHIPAGVIGPLKDPDDLQLRYDWNLFKNDV